MKKGLKLFAILMVLCSLLAIPFAQAWAIDEVPAPLDPQSWKLQRDMDWDELVANPVINWLDDWGDYSGETRTIKGALILVEYWDRPFIISGEEHSDVLGWQLLGEKGITHNPLVSVEKDNLAQWWTAYLNTPQEINHGLTINEYWRENSYGKWEVEVDGFGPYTIPYFEFETMRYDLRSFNSLEDIMPTFRPASVNNAYNFDTVVQQEIIQETTDFNLDDYDFFFILHAGYAESGVWQEFGEMQFATPADVPYELGPGYRMEQVETILTENPEYMEILAERYPTRQIFQDYQAAIEAGSYEGFEFPQADWDWVEEHGNTASTRYVDWTSWAAAVGEWAHMSRYTYTTGEGVSRTISYSNQGENSGMSTYAHEFGHISTLGDNYGNPFGALQRRANTGSWDLMSRGSFGGPGGDHYRWTIPAMAGSTVPPHLMQSAKEEIDVYDDGDVVTLSYAELMSSTPVVAEVVARNIPLDTADNDFGVPRDQFTKGIKIAFEYNGQDAAYDSSLIGSNGDPITNDTWNNPFVKKASAYTVEVIQRTGYDSFLHDSGVLIARATTYGGSTGAGNPGSTHRVMIDAHPEDINLVDYTLNGEDIYFTLGHQMQLADALFHAGISETENEYGISGDTVNEWQDEANKLNFYIIDKTMNPGNYDEFLSYTVGVLHQDGVPVTGELQVQLAELEKEEAGKVAVQWVNIVSGGNAEDIYRLDVSSGLGWDITILNNFYALGEFEHVKVPIYISIPEGAQIGTVDDFDLTITVSSESNSARSHSVTVADIGNTVIAGTEATPVEPLASISAPSEVYLDGSREIHYVVSVDDIQRAGAFVLEGQFDLNRLDYIGTEVNLAAKHEAFAYELADAYDAATGRYWLPIVLRGDDFRTYEEAALLTIKFKVKDSFGDESLYQNVTGNLNWLEVTLLDANRNATEVLATIVKGSADTMISKKGLKYDINKDDKYTMADIVMIMDRYYKVNSNDAAWADAVTYDIVADGEINTGDLVAFLDLLYK